MKSLFKVLLTVLFVTVTGVAMADDIRGGAVIVVPAHPYHHHHRHHRHYHNHGGVSLGVGVGIH